MKQMKMTSGNRVSSFTLPQFSDLFPWLSPFGLTSTPKPLWVRDPLDDYAAYGLRTYVVSKAANPKGLSSRRLPEKV